MLRTPKKLKTKGKPRKRQQATRRDSVRSMKGFSFSFPWKTMAFVIFFVVPIVMFVAGNKWINNPENLTIQTVDVKGALTILDKDALQSLIDPYTKTNLYLLDTKALEKSIESNPWVYSASMTKVWPDTLVIKIFEQNPIAFWGDEAMLASNGEIVKAVLDKADSKLPLLFSPNDKGRNMATGFLKIRTWMKNFPLKMVEFKEDTRGSWQITLENGMTLKIGRNQQEKRLRRFMVGYDKSLVNVVDKISVVDLRYTNGFSIKWKKGLSADSVLKGI